MTDGEERKTLEFSRNNSDATIQPRGWVRRTDLGGVKVGAHTTPEPHSPGGRGRGQRRAQSSTNRRGNHPTEARGSVDVLQMHGYTRVADADVVDMHGALLASTQPLVHLLQTKILFCHSNPLRFVEDLCGLQRLQKIDVADSQVEVLPSVVQWSRLRQLRIL